VFSLRTKITGLLAVAITITVVVLGTLSYALMIKSLLSLQQHNLAHLATTSAREIGRNLNDLQDNFHKILSSRVLHRGSDLPMAKYLSKHQERFAELSLLNQEGHEELRLIKQRIVDPNELRNWGESDIFRQGMSNPNKVIMSPVTSHKELGVPTITMAIAQVQYFGDEFQSMLIGSIPVESILNEIDKSTYGGEGFITILDSRQRILYAPKVSEVLKPISQVISLEDSTPLESIFSNSSGLFEASFLGQDSYISSWTDPVSNWTVMAVLPKDVFMSEPNRLRNTTIFICLVLLMGGMIIAYRGASHLTRDIDSLIENTRQIAAGNLSSRVQVTSHDEVAILGTSFNEMTDQLARSKEARDRLDTILQSIIDPLLVTDNEGLIQRVNKAAMVMLQADDKVLQGTPIESIFPERLQHDSYNSFLEMVQEFPLQNYETQVLSKAGEKIPVLLSGSYVRMVAEQESGLVVIIKDISTRKSIEEALNLALAQAEDARDQVDAILRSVVDGLIVTDAKQRVVLMNRAAEKFFDTELQEFLGRPAKDLISNQVVLDYLQRKLDNPNSEEVLEFEFNLPSETVPKIIQARTASVQNQSGLTSGLITTLRNVTDERKVERMKNEFISTAAHELNTPISTIMGFSELLLDPETYGTFTNKQRQEFLTEIFEKSDVLARLVSDLLDISRMETGHAMPLDKTLTNINKAILKATHCYQATNSSHDFAFDLKKTADIEILIDQQRITQVLENLINNAIKYSPAGSRISINSRLNCASLLISVADQGVGMTKEQADRIFDKFYRAETLDTSVGGLGMGMSIVQNILHSHGGTIDVSSVHGVGTTVTFGLPMQSLE